jgi:hypothetical protein
LSRGWYYDKDGLLSSDPTLIRWFGGDYGPYEVKIKIEVVESEMAGKCPSDLGESSK